MCTQTNTYMHPLNMYLTYKCRNYNSVVYGNKNVVGTSTGGSPREEMSENYEESSASSSMIQGFDSRSSNSMKSYTRGGNFHESSEISHTGWCLLFHGYCISVYHMFVQGVRWSNWYLTLVLHCIRVYEHTLNLNLDKAIQFAVVWFAWIKL